MLERGSVLHRNVNLGLIGPPYINRSKRGQIDSVHDVFS